MRKPNCLLILFSLVQWHVYKALLLTILAVALGSQVQAAAPVILVVGDSLSAGYGLRIEDAWPSLLQDELAAAGQPHRLVNASISGETTLGGRYRLDALLREHQPAIVIIALGANDGLRALPTNTMKANLRAMLDVSEQAGSRVLLAGMRMPPNYGPDYTVAFSAVYKDLSEDYGVPLLEFLLAGVLPGADYFQADGLHPNAAAQPIIVDNIRPLLMPLMN